MVKAWLVFLAFLFLPSLSLAAEVSRSTTDEKAKTARKLLAEGKAGEAKAAFEQLIAQYPDDADLQLFLGMSLLRLRDPQTAVLAVKKAISLNPNHADARTLLAWIESEIRGDIDTAIGEYRRVVELRPELPESYSNLAVALKKKGDLPGALTNLNKALELRPESGAALTARGAIFAEQRQWQDARRDFEQALALNPNDDGALYGLAQVLREEKDYAGAQDKLGSLITRSPNFVYWLEWGRIGLIRYWWVLLTVAILLAIKGRMKKVRTQADG